MPAANTTSAETAAQLVLDQVVACIEQHRNFVLEAGAGAGKTTSLIDALQYIISMHGDALLRTGQRVACITYTNVAKNEIVQRTDGHPVVLAETIHAFCWALLKDFQPYLRTAILELRHWPERLNEQGLVDASNKTIHYDLGYPSIKETKIFLHHDDVIALMVILMEMPKFRSIIAKRFPVILIDEYQDTASNLALSIKQNFLDSNTGPLLGFFGDHWQKIYGDGCGTIESSSLEHIDKGANFRSDKAIVEVLNKLRPELVQSMKSDASRGTATAFHTNNWTGMRREEPHWKGDLPAAEAHASLERLRGTLEADGWDMGKTKILMLTHNVLAEEQGYRNLAGVFTHSESFIKKEDDYIKFFADTVEPVCRAYMDHRFGDMFSVLGRSASITTHADKVKWVTDMNTLLGLRETGTIGQVIDCLIRTKRPHLPERIERNEQRLPLLSDESVKLSQEERKSLERVKKLHDIKYKEVISLTDFINEKTPFSTEHNVKGAEFDNVLVVVGRGWNHYDFGQMLSWLSGSVPAGKQETYERNRNLFYVCCSRPKHRLVLLFTQELSQDSINSLVRLFGTNEVKTCP